MKEFLVYKSKREPIAIVVAEDYVTALSIARSRVKAEFMVPVTIVRKEDANYKDWNRIVSKEGLHACAGLKSLIYHQL